MEASTEAQLSPRTQRQRAWTEPPVQPAEPYVHSETAACIRDSEGTFSERRARLDTSLQKSMKITKSELMQRNIVQGVNVVRRGSRALEGLLGARPALDEMVTSKKLPPDYLDKAFPTDQKDSVAPLADRIE